MAIYRLFNEPVFPDPREADPDGLLAIGGDLSPRRLVNAYAHGIFPWYAEGSPILWWSTAPRPVIVPGEIHVHRSLKRVINSGRFRCTLDACFEDVIRACAEAPRPGQDGTWIVPEMEAAYTELHHMGLAHSCEAWEGGELAGGVYGVSLGRAFFAESMFYRRENAGKVALVMLARALDAWGFDCIDCQQSTPSSRRFGARELPRAAFLGLLGKALEHPTRQGLWRMAGQGG